ncbi:MAG: hypothetical protein HYX93_01055 [Chloroflexi bacterium]|nr:hypothetical protein [Chloroflexota bacterium]
MRFLVVTLLGAMLSAGLLASAALASQSSSLATHGTGDYPQDRLTALVDDLVQEGVITQDQADVILERAASLLPGPRRVGHMLPGPFGMPFVLEKAAEELGLTPAELRAQLGEGSTIAEIAEAQGITLDELVSLITADVESELAQAVADGTLIQAEADERLERIRNVVTRLVTHEGRPVLGIGPHFRLHGQYIRGHHRWHQVADRIMPHLRSVITRATDLLGMEPQDILAQVREGSTIAEIAEAQGVTLDELVGVLTEDVETRLSQAVADGKLTQDEADARLERVTDMVTKVVTRSLPVVPTVLH